MTTAKIRILVVEDHTVVRKGLCALLAARNVTAARSWARRPMAWRP